MMNLCAGSDGLVLIAPHLLSVTAPPRPGHTQSLSDCGYLSIFRHRIHSRVECKLLLREVNVLRDGNGTRQSKGWYEHHRRFTSRKAIDIIRVSKLDPFDVYNSFPPEPVFSADQRSRRRGPGGATLYLVSHTVFESIVSQSMSDEANGSYIRSVLCNFCNGIEFS